MKAVTVSSHVSIASGVRAHVRYSMGMPGCLKRTSAKGLASSFVRRGVTVISMV